MQVTQLNPGAWEENTSEQHRSTNMYINGSGAGIFTYTLFTLSGKFCWLYIFKASNFCTLTITDHSAWINFMSENLIQALGKNVILNCNGSLFLFFFVLQVFFSSENHKINHMY